MTWTYLPPFNWISVPEWLNPFLRINGPDLLFEPRSGAQVVHPGETISMDNGEPVHEIKGAKS